MIFEIASAARSLDSLQPVRQVASFVWNEANLKAYISDPQKKVPGNRMPYGGMTNPNELDDIVAYLKVYK